MGFKIKNSLTGEFEKLPILTLKGEKGETGGVEEYNKVDYMGNKYETLKQANDANVEYAVKTAIGEFNYLDYDGQHITATDTIEGQSKSAILTGQTLVNLLTKSNIKITSNKFNNINYVYPLDNTKTYIVRYCVNQLPELSDANDSRAFKFEWYHGGNTGGHKNIYSKNVAVGRNEYIKVEPYYGEINRNNFGVWCMNHVSGTLDIDIMLIEYQEGMENWDIPYFEGMASVKAPVLKTTGKNLFDVRTVKKGYTLASTNGLESENVKRYTSDFIYVKGLTDITITNPQRTQNIWGYDENKQPIIKITENAINGNFVISLPSNITYIRIPIATINQDDITDEIIQNNLVQVEGGRQISSYEPHKSNILSTPEDLELRGIGDVKDELNISTREKVERIGEVVLDGSESIKMDYPNNLVDTLAFVITNTSNNNKDNGVIKSNIFQGVDGNTYWNVDKEGIMSSSLGFKVRILKTKLNTVDINGVKQWLSQNNLTVQYQLATPTTKTVDLSTNHVYSYQDTTHYDCSSAEGSLVPTLSVKVPTDVQATIAQQRETIQTLNSENERLNQIQEALKASMLDSQVQLMNLSWDTDFEVFTLRESIAPKDFLLASRTGSNIDKFSQAKFIIENDCPDLEKLNSQIEYYFSKDVFSQEQFEELTDLISIVKGGNGCEY